MPCPSIPKSTFPTNTLRLHAVVQIIMVIRIFVLESLRHAGNFRLVWAFDLPPKRKRWDDSFISLGKRIAIVLGSILAGLVLVGLVFGLICCLCCKKKGIIDELSLYHGINLSTFFFSFRRVSCNSPLLMQLHSRLSFPLDSLLVLRKKVGEEKAFLVRSDWLCHRCW